MKKPREIHLTISFIRGLNNPGYYIELSGTDEAGFEVRDEDKPAEKIHTIGHEIGHFLCDYFLPNLSTKRRKLSLTKEEEHNLCHKAGMFLELLLKPYLRKYYREDSLGTQK